MTSSRKPLDKDLYADVVAEAKERFDVWPSAYASGWVVKTYKARGGRYAGGDRKTRSGLTKWFGESWVDLSRPIHDEDGELVGYEPCGRKASDDPAAYPKCRPLAEAMRMSPSEVKDAIKRKRAAEAKAGRGGRGGRGARAPVRVSTYRKNPDVSSTQAFRRWFGYSKVVDENGEPLVVWHGHQSEAGSFHVFDFDRAIDLGMHFGTKQAAKDAVKGRKSRENVRPFYLSLQNPLLLTDPSDWIGVFQVPVLEELLREGVITKKQHKEAYAKVKALASKSAVEKALRSRDRAFVKERSVAVSQIVRDVIVDAGYDGVVYANETEDVGSFSWVAFYPEQIKLADGTNTTFDPTNPDVRANPRPDGDALTAWCASDESYAVLDETASAGSSWMAGACVLLAKAIRKRYPEARLVGIETDGVIQHVGARIGDTVYDALGEHDPHAWARDWLAYEQLPARTLVRVVSLKGTPRSALPDAESPATPADVALVARALP